MELELVRVKLQAVDGDDRGTAELPVGWTIEVGDLPTREFPWAGMAIPRWWPSALNRATFLG